MDATDRRDTLDQLRDAHETRRLLLRTVFHDIITPLTSARMAVELARGDASESDDLLATAQQQLGRIERLLTDLRDLDVVEQAAIRARPVATDLGDLMAQVVDGLDRDGARRVLLDIEVAEVVIDPVLTSRMAENLLRNALEHTPPGSTVTIRAVREADTLMLCVEDDGAGIPEELLEEIFQPYRRASEARRGQLGLGLTLVRDYARLQGGVANASNRPGGGARLEVRIPLDRGERVSGARTGGPAVDSDGDG